MEIKNFGRKGTLGVSTVLTGVFLYASTTALDSNTLLGWNCGFSFASNVMVRSERLRAGLVICKYSDRYQYAVLYAYTPEVFPTKDRGTGNALTATSNRIFGIMAPIIAMFANLQTSAPVYTSGALFIAAGLICIILPYEPRGKASL